MEFATVYGHNEIKARLLNAFRLNRLPSAYLWVGPEGIGKSLLAREFARLINCESQNGCGWCPNCRLFSGGAHPDFEVIKPSGRDIRIRQVQDLIENLTLKPAYATKRIILVKQSDRLNAESANAFLKILEEPPLNTLLILSSSDENLLLETILSRCQKMVFSPLSQEQLQQILSEKYRLNPEETEFVLHYSRGHIRKDLIGDIPSMMRLRDQILPMLHHPSVEELQRQLELIEEWCKKDLQGFVLEFIADGLLALSRLKTGQITPGMMLNPPDAVSPESIAYSLEQLQWLFDLTIETELAIRANAAKVLALESLMIQFKQIYEGAVVI